MDLAIIGLTTFGAVWIISYYWKLWKKTDIDTTTKLLIQGILVFLILSFPIDTLNFYLNNIKIAIEVVTGATALYQAPKAVLRSVGK